MSSDGNGSENSPEIRALEKMKHDVGQSDCRWEFLDDDEAVSANVEGTQTMSFVIEDSVMQVFMDVPEMATQSVTHRFFDPIRQKLFWNSVDNQGEQWSFVEELDGKPSYSLPHLDSEGVTTFLRFSLLRETPDEVDVLMEMSLDEKAWKPIFRQYRIRRLG